MDKPNWIVHNVHQELWFRSSPTLPFAVLSQFLDSRGILVTPRLGKRNASHPKGYLPDTTATVRLFDDCWREKLREDVLIIRVVSKPLRDFEDLDLTNTVYRSVESMQRDLSFFEERPIASDETVSLVEFSYLNRKE